MNLTPTFFNQISVNYRKLLLASVGFLLLALVGSQFLLVQHELTHALEDSETDCEICHFLSGATTLLPEVGAITQTQAFIALILTLSVAFTLQQVSYHIQARGPPAVVR